jgi:protein SCO1
MNNKWTIRVFVIMVFIVPLFAWSLMNVYEKRIKTLPVLGPKGHRVGDFLLINQYGYVKSTRDWDNKIIVADFFFTHCPVICPKMTNNLKKVNKVFSNDPVVLINSFSVDPENDNSVQLKRFADRFGIQDTHWDLLTGDKRVIYKLARNSFMLVVTDGDGGPDDFIHSEKVVLVDKKKRIRGYYDGTNEQEIKQLIIDINKLKNEK